MAQRRAAVGNNDPSNTTRAWFSILIQDEMTVGREFNLELTALSRSRKYRLIQIRINLFIGGTWIADDYDGIGWKKLDSLVYHRSARGQHELIWPSVGSTARVPFCAHRTNNWSFPTDLKPASTLIPGKHFLHLKFRLGQHSSSSSRWKLLL